MIESHSPHVDPVQPQLRLFQPPPVPPPPPTVAAPAGDGPPRPSMDVEAALKRFVLPQMRELDRSPATIQDVSRSVREWREFWTARKAERPNDQWITDPLVVRHIRRQHLETWRSALIADARKLSPSSVNRKLGAIRQVLRACEKHGKLKKSRPQLEKLPTKAAPKFYMKREQVELLWPHCDALTWPRLPGMTTGEWWRCAIVLFWVYGFRTQELIAFQRDKRGLAWSSITSDAETPNPEGTAASALGWLSYVPQKQKWAKPEPLYLPLTKHTRAAVNLLKHAATITLEDGQAIDPARRLFPWPGTAKSFYREWELLQERAGVATKRGEPFLFKHLRKSAATYLEGHHKGLGAAVCGWADREVSVVMSRHYAVDELTLVEKLATYPVPVCFDDLQSRGGQLSLF